MPKKQLKQWLPKPESFKSNHRFRQFFGNMLHQPFIWTLNRSGVSRAVFLGLFLCFLPIPFQMLLAVFLCILLRANLPLTISLVWISNPLTMIPMFYAAYVLGCYLLDLPVQVPSTSNFDLRTFFDAVGENWLPLVVGCVVTGLITATCGYFIIRLLWRLNVSRRWQARKKKRLKKHSIKE